jgi:hypothetical protein
MCLGIHHRFSFDVSVFFGTSKLKVAGVFVVYLLFS